MMTALTKIQHSCMRVPRVTVISVSTRLLPERLGTSLQVNSSGVQTWRFAVELKPTLKCVEFYTYWHEMREVSVTELLDPKCLM
jgi:hypothetical protein